MLPTTLAKSNTTSVIFVATCHNHDFGFVRLLECSDRMRRTSANKHTTNNAMREIACDYYGIIWKKTLARITADLLSVLRDSWTSDALGLVYMP